MLSQVQHLSPSAAQVVVARTLDLEIKTIEKKVLQKDQSVRIEMTLTQEEAEEIKYLKDLISHAHPNPNVDLASKRYETDNTSSATNGKAETNAASRASNKVQANVARVQRGDDKQSITLGPHTQAAGISSKTSSKITSPNEVAKYYDPQYSVGRTLKAGYIRASDRRAVFRKDRCCQWKGANEKVCGSTFQLQLDHKISRWLGGTNDVSNLQLLCSAHNKIKYEREIGLH